MEIHIHRKFAHDKQTRHSQHAAMGFTRDTRVLPTGSCSLFRAVRRLRACTTVTAHGIGSVQQSAIVSTAPRITSTSNGRPLTRIHRPNLRSKGRLSSRPRTQHSSLLRKVFNTTRRTASYMVNRPKPRRHRHLGNLKAPCGCQLWQQLLLSPS